MLTFPHPPMPVRRGLRRSSERKALGDTDGDLAGRRNRLQGKALERSHTSPRLTPEIGSETGAGIGSEIGADVGMQTARTRARARAPPARAAEADARRSPEEKIDLEMAPQHGHGDWHGRRLGGRPRRRNARTGSRERRAGSHECRAYERERNLRGMEQ